eukprot:gene9271-11363_t
MSSEISDQRRDEIDRTMIHQIDICANGIQKLDQIIQEAYDPTDLFSTVQLYQKLGPRVILYKGASDQLRHLLHTISTDFKKLRAFRLSNKIKEREKYCKPTYSNDTTHSKLSKSLKADIDSNLWNDEIYENMDFNPEEQQIYEQENEHLVKELETLNDQIHQVNRQMEELTSMLDGIIPHIMSHREMIEDIHQKNVDAINHHRVHHSSNIEYLDKNYGGVLIIWDILFGTFIEEDESIDIRYGITEEVNSYSPFWLNAHHFVHMYNLSKKLNGLIKSWIEGQQIDIHVVPFSILSTLDETQDEYYESTAKNIISNLITVLNQNSNRKIIWPEVFYFEKWWNQQSSTLQSSVKQLVRNGQIEFVNGGMSMIDEGVLHFNEIIDQLSQGTQWLISNFGSVPKNYFNPISFGHSSTVPFILNSVGIQNMVINLINKEIKSQMKSNQHLEFFWEDNNPAGYWNSSHFKVFTHVLPDDNIDISHTCGPNFEICSLYDFENGENTVEIGSHNVKQLSIHLLEQYKAKASGFRTPVVLIPLGGFSKYSNQKMTDLMFDNYEKIFEYINSNPELKAKISFSTLKDYFDAVKHNTVPLNLAPVKKFGLEIETEVQMVPAYQGTPDSREYTIFKGDLFPYSNDNQQFFSGLFSSIPSIRQDVTQASTLLHTIERFYALTTGMPQKEKSEIFKSLGQCKSVITQFNGRDIVTGLSNNYKIYEYFAQEISKCKTEFNQILAKLSQSLLECTEPDTPRLLLLNENQHQEQEPTKSDIYVEMEDGKSKTLFIYNPIEIKKEEIIKIIVNTPNVVVRNSNDSPVMSQISPIWKGTELSPIGGSFELEFIAQVDPLAVGIYSLHYSHKPVTTISVYTTILSESSLELETIEFEPFVINRARLSSQEIVIENSIYKLLFNFQSGLLEKLFLKKGKDMEEVLLEQQNMLFQSKETGNDTIMSEGEPIPQKTPISLVRIVKGPVSESVVVFRDNNQTPFKKQTYQLTNCLDSLRHECLEISKVIFYENIINYQETPAKGDPIVRFSLNSTPVLNAFNLNDHANNPASLNSNSNKKNSFYYTDSNGISFIPRKTNQFSPYHSKFYPMSSVSMFGDTNSVSGIRIAVFTPLTLGVTAKSEGSIDILVNKYRDQQQPQTIRIPLWLSVGQQGKEVSQPSYPHLISNMIRNPMNVQLYGTTLTKLQCKHNEFSSGVKIPPSTQILSFSPVDEDLIQMHFISTDKMRPGSPTSSSAINVIRLESIFPKYRFPKTFHTNLIISELTDKSNNSTKSISPGQILSFLAKMAFDGRTSVAESESVNPYSYTNNQDQPKAFKQPVISKEKDGKNNLNSQFNSFSPDNEFKKPPNFKAANNKKQESENIIELKQVETQSPASVTETKQESKPVESPTPNIYSNEREKNEILKAIQGYRKQVEELETKKKEIIVANAEKELEVGELKKQIEGLNGKIVALTIERDRHIEIHKVQLQDHIDQKQVMSSRLKEQDDKITELLKEKESLQKELSNLKQPSLPSSKKITTDDIKQKEIQKKIEQTLKKKQSKKEEGTQENSEPPADEFIGKATLNFIENIINKMASGNKDNKIPKLNERLDEKNMTPLEKQLRQLEKDFEMERVILKHQMSEMKKKPPNPHKIYTKEASIKYIDNQQRVLEEIREKIKEDPSLQNMPLEQIYDGELILGKKLAEPVKKKSGTTLFYILMGSTALFCLGYIMYLLRAKKIQFQSIVSSSSTACSSSNSPKSTSIDVYSFFNKNQERKTE